MGLRPLTEQMREYISALYYQGNVRGCGFGPGYDSTRKALVKRGLIQRVPRGDSGYYILTDDGLKVGATLPKPTNTPDAFAQARLDQIRRAGW